MRLRLVGGTDDHAPEYGLSGGAAVEPGGASQQPRKDHPIRVLVADDEPTIRLLLKVNLGLAGIEVIEASNGVEALEQASTADLDLAILDVMMPDLDGHEVARVLRGGDATTALPIIFLSARAARSDLRRGYELGAVDYITKPFDPISIAERVQEVLARVKAGTAEPIRLARLEQLNDVG